MPKSYTGNGDNGTTGRFGGERLKKSAPLVSALGDLDEANATIGLARMLIQQKPSGKTGDSLEKQLEEIQHTLFRIGADITTPVRHRNPRSPRITEEDTASLERKIDALDAKLPKLQNFILPSGTAAATALHLARAIVRRAERDLIAARDSGETLNPALFPYCNRLSSYLFSLARAENFENGVEETPPHYCP